MKKSMLAFLLALVMVLSLFAGCGKQEETPAQETEQSPAAETEQSPAAETEQAPETPAEVSFPLSETYTVDAFAFSNPGNELDKTLTMQVM